MSVEKLLRAIVIAGASLATAWWLAPDSVRRERNAAPSAGAEGFRDPLLEDAGPNFVPEEATSGADAVPAGQLAVPVAGEPSTVAAVVTDGAVEPIPMIEGITLPGGMWNLHTRLQREVRDAVWADEMERQFSAYFASKPELGHNFGQPSVLCRSHTCEIQAVGYGPRPFDTWKTATEDLRDQAWAGGLHAGGIYTVERAPNERAVVLILMRAPRVVVRDGLIETRIGNELIDVRRAPPASN